MGPAVKRFVFVCALLAMSVNASAQPIHGHPQKAFYASPDEYPWADAQVQWKRPDGLIAHAHSGTWCSWYASVKAGDLITCRTMVMLFQMPGRVTDISTGFAALPSSGTSLWFDVLGHVVRPDQMVGDPSPRGLVMWTGTMQVPASERPSQWWFLQNQVNVQFDNGDTVAVRPQIPLWFDQPGDGTTWHHPRLQAITKGNSAAHPDIVYGDTVTTVESMLPIAPISTNWSYGWDAFPYQGANLPPFTTELVVDRNLHQDIPGTTLASYVGDNGTGGLATGAVGGVFTLDTAQYTPGTHKFTIATAQPDGDDEIWSVLVFAVTFDLNASPVQSPIDAPTPPPPPVIDLGQLVLPTFRLFNDGRLQVCIGKKCVEWVIQ